MKDVLVPSLECGVSVIKETVKSLPLSPGVYRMLGEAGEVLYIGKARELKKRVTSYTRVRALSERLRRMVAQTRAMEIVQTQTEAEALLLEANLINKLKPKFNILLRDDKSFPFISIDQSHDYPLIKKHRGKRRKEVKYYGPFASAGSVKHTLDMLQRLFMVRNCPDTVFRNRSRPCLQYHIKRCTAPCVGYVSREDYGRQIAQAQAFLEGRTVDVQALLAEEMDKASQALEYEKAALYRDKIKALTAVQLRQDINLSGLSDADVIVAAEGHGIVCVQVFFFRGGRNFGNYSYFPLQAAGQSLCEVLEAFIGQFYIRKPLAATILVNVALENEALLEAALTKQAGRRIKISVPKRGERKRVIDFALKNAKAALERQIAAKTSQAKLLESVAKLFGMEERPERIEVYDNSHIAGTDMVGAMIVAGPEGFQKNAYRKYTIRKADRSDDYGMMREILGRRFRRLMSEQNEKETDAVCPDLVLIDGGKGQLSAAQEVLADSGVLDRVTLVSIAKGKDRHAGRETFYMAGKAPFQLPFNDPALHYLQRLRDEAHRFAIGSHRQKRGAKISRSPLDEIPGIGASRKRALLAYFGSAKAVADATVDDLERVEGISAATAQVIYNFFH